MKIKRKELKIMKIMKNMKIENRLNNKQNKNKTQSKTQQHTINLRSSSQQFKFNVFIENR